jgi:hypothetical protein
MTWHERFDESRETIEAMLQDACLRALAGVTAYGVPVEDEMSINLWLGEEGETGCLWQVEERCLFSPEGILLTSFPARLSLSEMVERLGPVSPNSNIVSGFASLMLAQAEMRAQLADLEILLAT